MQRDINLTIWVLAWDSHALATDPARLFHANAMWPAPYTWRSTLDQQLRLVHDFGDMLLYETRR